MRENKFKVGDEVICIPGFTTINEDKYNEYGGYGGYGYKKGRIFTITKIDLNPKNFLNVMWNNENKGVYQKALQLYKKREVEYEIY